MERARLNPTALAATFVVSALVLAASGAGRFAAGVVLMNVIELGAAGWAAYACARAAERADGRARLAWRLLAASSAAWSLGQVVRSLLALAADRPQSSASLADIGLFLALVLAAAAVALFPSAGGAGRPALVIIDGLAIAAALVGIALTTFVGAIVASVGPGLAQVLALAYPIGDLILLAVVLSVLARVGPEWRRPLGLVGFGLFFLALADVSLAYLSAVGGYERGAATDVGWVAGFCLIALAGSGFPAEEAGRQHVAERWFGALPYAPVMVMVPIAAGNQLATGTIPAPLAWSGMATVLLVIARQLATHFENLRLSADLRSRVVALEGQEAWVRRILDTSSDAYIEIEVPSGVVTGWNGQAEAVFGWTKAEITGKPLGPLIYDHPEQIAFEYRLREYEAGPPGGGTHLMVDAHHRDGHRFPMEATVWVTESGGVRRAHAFARDVSERIEVEEGVRRSERRWRALVRNASDVITVLSAEGQIESATPAAERMLGWTERQQRGRHIADFVHPDDRDVVLGTFNRATLASGVTQRTELRIARRDGTWAWVEVVGTNMLDDPDVGGFVCNVRDISERKEAEERLRHQASHDPLTGLPNRSALTEAADRAAAQPDSRHALLLMDLDRFKEINDGLGHAVGDRVLIEVAKRLREATRAWDVVSRLGGDEFALLATDLRDDDAIAGIATKILERVSEPIEIEAGFILQLSGSIGVAVAPEHGDSALPLLQKADVAMYRAKASGSGWSMYGAGDEEDTRRRVGLVADLGRALERNELALHYQPKVDPRTGRVSGVEALIRWNHPTRGAVSPAEFIVLAEHTGLIRPITRWVLHTAIGQSRTWRNEGIDIGMAVNVSPRSLGDPELMTSIIESLVEFGVEANRLTLEITETAVAQLGQAGSVVARLRHFGVRISVDDFGTGYSSMTYLKNLPIDELKIDQSFVLDVVDDDRDRAIVQAIVTMARSLGLQVVAEGAESDQAVRAVGDLGCDLVQGYAVARPAAAADLTGWLLQPGRLADDGGQHAGPAAGVDQA